MWSSLNIFSSDRSSGNAHVAPFVHLSSLSLSSSKVSIRGLSGGIIHQTFGAEILRLVTKEILLPRSLSGSGVRSNIFGNSAIKLIVHLHSIMLLPDLS